MGIDIALLRECRIESLNSTMCHLDGEREGDSPLNMIAYAPKDPDATEDTTDIATLMLNLPWRETYGLSYNQVLCLPFDEWYVMYTLLAKKEETKPPSPVVTAIHGLTERLTQLMCVAFNLKRKEDRK